MSFYTWDLPSPLGDITLAERDNALTGLVFPTERHPRDRSGAERRLTPLLTEATLQLNQYFAHQRQDFQLPLAPEGTEFQQRVWSELLHIPFGQTWSYGQLAIRLGDLKAVRAVGAANGKNPISIIIPCHRVIGADGKLVGYGGGMDRKRWLLDWEREELPLFSTLK